jgi:hypothetical protein
MQPDWRSQTRRPKEIRSPNSELRSRASLRMAALRTSNQVSCTDRVSPLESSVRLGPASRVSAFGLRTSDFSPTLCPTPINVYC